MHHESTTSSISISAPTVLVELPAHHVLSAISAQDLEQLCAWVPPSGTALVRLLGAPAALALINGLGGLQIMVPKGQGNNHQGARAWAQIAAVVGEGAMRTLAREWGGQWLEVPTLQALRTERRNRALRAQFDQLTTSVPIGAGLSKARAVQELCLRFAPITWRQIEVIVDRASTSPYSNAQAELGL